ncbi:hypothetical protein M514_07225 [Trichuris suis]|uniref:Uncharacterized protein n=1 Tax=Trichuris suis TaxID=68888 RepID=A0A085NC48_9BILA|nr:hypothetical protein M513_07225 [Trichuris suis]KFD67044.1 hypothetical protein M514_07225 [Trichuris suis]
MLPDDSLALTILRKSIRLTGNRYELGMLWKSPQLCLPDNEAAMLRRFYNAERRVMRQPWLARAYTKAMEETLKLHHAERIVAKRSHTAARVWFLPHHTVFSPQQPEKIRIAFNASARHKGLSMNDCLFKGPDFLTDLSGLLLRFRYRRVPLSEGVEKMYHQVEVPEMDRSAFRFFWRTPGSETKPAVYQMRVHVFSVASSPSCCIYPLRQAAEDYRSIYPDAADRILNHMYVDNLLDSVDLSKQTTAILSKSGFPLRKWAPSSRQVLAKIPRSERANPQLDLTQEVLGEEKTLGLLWDCEEDVHCFNFSPSSNHTPTKRQILNISARVFDPLRLISPVTITARILLQEL